MITTRLSTLSFLFHTPIFFLCICIYIYNYIYILFSTWRLLWEGYKRCIFVAMVTELKVIRVRKLFGGIVCAYNLHEFLHTSNLSHSTELPLIANVCAIVCVVFESSVTVSKLNLTYHPHMHTYV